MKEMSITPLVSVRCLCYNHEKYLRNAIDGILMQETDFPFEVIIHDDASSDGSQSIIREYAKKYPQIIVPVLQEENQYSKGIRITKIFIEPLIRGKYCALCECDDYWTDKHKLQKQIDFLETHPDYSICGHSFLTVDRQGNYMYRDRRVKNGEHDISLEDIILNKDMPQTATLVYRQKDRTEMPEFFDKVLVGDYPLRLYMSTRGKFHYMPDGMSCYRRHGEGSWVTKLSSGDALFETHISLMIKLIENFDVYTGEKHTDLVNLRISYCNFLRYKRQKNVGEIFKNQYFRWLKPTEKARILLKMFLKRT